MSSEFFSLADGNHDPPTQLIEAVRERCEKICQDYAAIQSPGWLQPKHALNICATSIHCADFSDLVPKMAEGETPRTDARWKQEWDTKSEDANADHAHGMLDLAAQLERELAAKKEERRAKRYKERLEAAEAKLLSVERETSVEMLKAVQLPVELSDGEIYGTMLAQAVREMKE